MKTWWDEALRTFSVTAMHPMGWGYKKIRSRVVPRTAFEAPVSREELRQEREAPVLLIHGIFHNATAFYRFERHLARHGFTQLHTIELWTSLRSLEGLARQVREEAMRLREAARSAVGGEPPKIRIVAHSIGGMVVRAALLDPTFAANVEKVVFLGVPHQGNVFYRLPFPRCLRDLTFEAPLMRRLRTEPLPAGISFWNLRGGILDVVTPKRDTFLPHVPNVVFDHVGHAGLLADRQVTDTVASILETPVSREDLASDAGEALASPELRA